ncbi:MAG: PIG-L deacetylase family protein, partial [Dehalococcoidia bacterium]|nr:PIG-L deacetylase family protein [Dehalococcoidia bacterium]
MGRTLLAVFAHPDDESYGPGGVLARYAAEGVEVHLVTATRGEEGTLGDPPLCTSEELGRVREGELRCACQVLGIGDLRLLGYRDGALDRQDPDEIEEKIVRAIRELRPQVVLTFPPDGITGHPDHITVHQCTVRAFEHAGDGTFFPHHIAQGLKPYRPAKLYFDALPSERVRTLGLDLTSHDEHITTVIDVAGYIDAKMSAIRCHRTQTDFPSLTAEQAREFLSQEHFWLAY